jgi:uncharacterized hydrophobic protein (TIGR00271 family)
VPTVTAADIDRMTTSLFLSEGDSAAKRSKFWILLVLAAIIATAGVVADSTATVIGAMIVAPLMTPIIGAALAIVLADRANAVRSALLVLLGAACVVGIAFLVGLVIQIPVVAEGNAQVAARVSPRLIDLIAALATGAVGAFALCREDVSDTLPGVAIAISLVPPLAVVGLTLESGEPAQALGALLLFGTNVAAIIAMGTLVLMIYRVRDTAAAAGRAVGQLHGSTLAIVAAMLVLVAVPLGIGSYQVYQQEQIKRRATPVANHWAEASGWLVTDVSYRQGLLRIIALGPPPELDERQLRRQLDAAGLQKVDARVTLVVGGARDLPAGSPH